jgi:O-antigen ligase
MSATAGLFVLLFTAGCMLALARHPIFGVMTYVLLFYVSPSDRWWGQGATLGVRWALIAAVVTALALMIHRPQRPAIPLTRQPLMWGFVIFVAWVGLQSFWAIRSTEHGALLGYYLKYVVAMYLIYRSVDSELNLKRFMWAHVLGCAYISWIAFTTSDGGRFDSFGGAGIGDANSGALTIVTGILAGASLFIAGPNKARAGLVGIMPLLLNAVIATISRSGFLALGVAGLAFNMFSPRKYSKLILVLSLVGLALFLALTNPVYWARIQSIKYQGEQVEGVDTGSKRLLLAQAQLSMFVDRPLGCGAECTDALSPGYLDAKQLAGAPGEESRSSHNTFLTMLVDHGIPGGIAYVAMTAWIVFSLRRLRRDCRGTDDFLAKILPAIAGGILAISVGDMFVQYPKLEVRFWLLTIVMSMLSMVAARRAQETVRTESPVHYSPVPTGVGQV